MGSEAVKAEGSGGGWSCPAEDCSYSSKNKSKVTIHIRRHAGEKPFHCVCGYKAAVKSSLTEHLGNMTRCEPELHWEVPASKGKKTEKKKKKEKKEKKKRPETTRASR